MSTGMEFHQAANYLLDLRRYSIRPGTDATRELLSELGDPQTDLACVQVAGSNGKGSTARMLESTLREAGLDVGLYTSPHLEDVRERIRTNGRKISERSIVEFAERIQAYVTDRAVAGESPTFFESITALAIWEFATQDVDVAVLEVGIGGTHDATSVVDPIAGAVSSVALEHTEILGDDVETIARDLAGIGPLDGPLVTGAAGDALAAIQETDHETLVVGQNDADVAVTYGGREALEGVVAIAGPDWGVETRLPLLGAHQARNAGVAATLARQVLAHDDVSPDDQQTGPTDLDGGTLARGLRNAHWPGRFEVMSHNPLVVLDGAHNPGGASRVAETLSSFEFDQLHVVAGILADKDYRGIARELPTPDRVRTCEPDLDRAEDAEVLARAFETETDARVDAQATVCDAVSDALESADSEDCVLVTGSLYTVGEARRRWSRTTIPKRVETAEDADSVLSRAHVPATRRRQVSEQTVHHVLKTHVRPRQARQLRQTLLAIGGECAISGLDVQDRENVSVVMTATMAQFRRLAARLDENPGGLDSLAETVRERLDPAGGTDGGNYPWQRGTAIMGILNVTPDSFHDGGEYNERPEAIARAEEMVAEGADIVDVGGESTRPGADPVPVEEEKARVLPVVERLADLDCLVSIDTRKAPVARAALEAGADILNDVSGLADPEMRLVAAEYDVPVVVMHSIDTPVVPDKEIHYDDVVEDVIDSLVERVLLAEKAGLDRSQIIVDPGLGFGKSSAESFELLGRLDELQGLGCPILIGHSHKSMFELVDRDSGDRYEPTVAATALAAERGVDIVRVHDVAANRAAVDVVSAADDSGEWE